MNNPCSFGISEKEFLIHMIPHHQVAIDISKKMQKITKWTSLQQILRELIWVQEYEIYLMQEMLEKIPKNISDTQMNMNNVFLPTIGSYAKPNKVGLTNIYCDPLFFDPKKHLEKLNKMKLTDDMYIEHMIPHHQVAIDMSKKLLQRTKNDFMIYLCYRIIRSQEHEVFVLHNLKKSIYVMNSNLLL